MVLINISPAEWRPGRMKRNLSIFTTLMECGSFEQGIYVHVTQVKARGIRDYFRIPFIETVAAQTIAGSPVVVLQPHGAFPGAYRLHASSRLTGMVFARHIRRLIGDRAYCVWMNAITPVECGTLEALAAGAKRVVLDCSDDLPTLEVPHLRGNAERRLARILRLADHVVCVNAKVADRIEHPSKHVFRNCTTYRSLRAETPGFRVDPWVPKPPGSTYIGFIGSLHHDRVDVVLLKYLFQRFSQYQFLFVGWVSEELMPVVSAYSNAHVLAEVPNNVLGMVIRSFSVAIVPHLDNRATQGNDLLKLLDFNACEVPVVSSLVSGVNTSEYVVLVASTHEQFGDYVQACIDGRHGLDLKRGSEIAHDRSWDKEVPKLLPLLDVQLRVGKDGIPHGG